MPSSMKRHSWESVLTCCDSFKGTLTACNAGLALERAFRCVEKGGSARAEVVHCPMSDGGAGLLDSLFFPSHSALSSPYIFTRVDVPTAGTTDSCDSTPAPLVLGPLGEPLNYSGGEYRPHFACDVANRVVVVEMAVASGLPMIPEAKRNPLRTTSYGVGQIIKYAVEYVAREHRRKDGPGADGGVTVFLGIGGSATNDGGLGALQALGVEMLVKAKDGGSEPLTTPFTGGDLAGTSPVSAVGLLAQTIVERGARDPKLPQLLFELAHQVKQVARDSGIKLSLTQCETLMTACKIVFSAWGADRGATPFVPPFFKELRHTEDGLGLSTEQQEHLTSITKEFCTH